MKNAAKVVILFSFIWAGCRPAENKVTAAKQPDTKTEADPVKKVTDIFIDTSDKGLYRFMKMVIATRHLDTSYGLLIEPEEWCSIENDETFLRTLMITPERKATGSNAERTGADSIAISAGDSSLTKFNFVSPLQIIDRDYIINEPRKILSHPDIKYMLSQKTLHKGFRWNAGRLGFDTANHKKFYSFSIVFKRLFKSDNEGRRALPVFMWLGQHVLFYPTVKKMEVRNVRSGMGVLSKLFAMNGGLYKKTINVIVNEPAKA